MSSLVLGSSVHPVPRAGPQNPEMGLLHHKMSPCPEEALLGWSPLGPCWHGPLWSLRAGGVKFPVVINTAGQYQSLADLGLQPHGASEGLAGLDHLLPRKSRPTILLNGQRWQSPPLAPSRPRDAGDTWQAPSACFWDGPNLQGQVLCSRCASSLLTYPAFLSMPFQPLRPGAYTLTRSALCGQGTTA